MSSVLRFTLCFFIAVFFGQPLAFGQSGPVSDNYYEVTRDRQTNRPAVHLFGDSIFRGYALRQFPDQFTDAQRAEPSIWSLSSPAAMMEQIADGQYSPVYAGQSGLPDRDLAARLRYLTRDGTIRAGDFVFFEDAGNHYLNPKRYADLLLKNRIALCDLDVHVVFLNTYDYIVPGTYLVPDENAYRWSVPVDGTTMNQVIEQVANKTIDGCQQSILLDIHSVFSRLDGQGLAPTNKDGVHPNIRGQWRMALAMHDLIIEALAARS